MVPVLPECGEFVIGEIARRALRKLSETTGVERLPGHSSYTTQYTTTQDLNAITRRTLLRPSASPPSALHVKMLTNEHPSFLSFAQSAHAAAVDLALALCPSDIRFRSALRQI